MADPINYLIGRGETLTQPIELASGSGEKAHPYTYDQAYEFLLPQLRRTSDAVAELPAMACPNDEAVVAVTLHPAYLAKSYHPSRLLGELGLRQIGSREQRLLPRRWTQKQAPEAPLVAPELYVAGDRHRLARLPELVGQLPDGALREEFRRIEAVRPLGRERLKSVAGDEEAPPMEVILHADAERRENANVIDGFYDWCAALGFEPEMEHRQQVGGLAFLGLHIPRSRIEDIAQFSFLRALRRMPRLTMRDVELRSIQTDRTFAVSLPDRQPVAAGIRVAIFDGGVPDDHVFGDLVEVMDYPDIGDPVPNAVRHGAQVTSALLFGPLAERTTPQRAFAPVSHWRVIDQDGDDFELMTTLTRIMSTLEQTPYDFVNLSLGPDEAMLDDEVHVWTSTLDQFASTGSCLIVSAAGNNGDFLEDAGLCRVQPPADGVNVLSVGASDSGGSRWARALYSAKGPGRSPGLVKPDVLAFGGSDDEPYYAIDETGRARGVSGTSFAAPSAARLGIGLRALFGSQLSPTAIKALMVHHASDGSHPQEEVGWGRLPGDLDGLSVCRDGEATVVYQGVLEPSRYRRFFLPIPSDGFTRRVELKATFVTATAVDPEDAITYTRTGVGITFRPKTVGHPGYTEVNGQRKAKAAHPSGAFFGNGKVFQSEQKLRDDAYRWESVKRAVRRFQPSTLEQPVFDIEHLTRAHGRNGIRSDGVNYALIVTIHEPGAVDLYNRVLRTYAGRLTALRPQIDVQVRT